MSTTVKTISTKRIYRAPSIIAEFINCENSIAAASATVTPVNASSEVQQEWETAPDVNRELLW